MQTIGILIHSQIKNTTMAKEIKVRVKREYPNIKEILPLNYECVLTPRYQDKDEMIFREYVTIDPWTREEIIKPAVWRHKGDFLDFVFTGANGGEYGTNTLVNFIGHVPLSDIFDKL